MAKYSQPLKFEEFLRLKNREDLMRKVRVVSIDLEGKENPYRVEPISTALRDTVAANGKNAQVTKQVADALQKILDGEKSAIIYEARLINGVSISGLKYEAV